jgi:hypothetical protein
LVTVDETDKKIASMKVKSAPDMIARALRETGSVELAVIEQAACHRQSAMGCGASGHSRRLYLCTAGASEPKGLEGEQDPSS